MAILRMASSLPGERLHLQELVKDLCSRELRASYADWLAAQGDHDRAGFLRQLDVVHQTMDGTDMPDVESVPLEWARMVGAASLRELLREGPYMPAVMLEKSQLAMSRDRMFDLARPAVNIEWELAAGDDGVGNSRLWGEPDLPEDMPWPTLGTCLRPFDWESDLSAPCAFMGQLNLSDFAESIVSSELPDEGILFFFSHIDQNVGALSVAMRFTADPADIRRRSPPSNLDEDNQTFPAHRVILSEALAFPHYDGPWEDDLMLSNEEKGVDDGAYHCIREGGGAALIGFLGYLQGTTGTDPTPDKSIRKLACLRVTPDLGIVHLALSDKDLGTGNFRAFTYPWHDFDL
jgi:uncharacterized protein (TIGR02996 family)